MMNLNVRCEKFSALCLALALVVVLLSGCGGTAQTGTPADGPVRVGQTVTVGGCEIYLAGCDVDSYYGNTLDWDNMYVAVDLAISNHTTKPVKIGNYLGEIFCTEMDMVISENEAHKTMQKFYDYAMGQRLAIGSCDEVEILCVATGLVGESQIGEAYLLSGNSGYTMIWCEVSKDWKSMEIEYTLNGETVTFVVYPDDAIA